MPNNNNKKKGISKSSRKEEAKKKAVASAAAAGAAIPAPTTTLKMDVKDSDLFDESNWLVQRRRDEEFGTYFVAKQDIRKGDVIGYDLEMLKVCLPCGDAPPNTNPFTNHFQRFKLHCVECNTPLSKNKKAYIECPHHRDDGDNNNKNGHCRCMQVYCSTKCQEWAWDHYHSVQDGDRVGQLVKYTMQGFTTSRLVVLFASKLVAMYKVGKTKNSKLIDFVDTLLETFKLPPMMSDESTGVDVTRVMEQIHDQVILVASSLSETIGQHMIVTGDGASLGMLGVGPDNKDSFSNKDWSPALPKPFHTTKGLVKCIALITSYCFGDMTWMAMMGPTNFFNHSCIPNAATSSIMGNVWTITATRDIPKGSQVFICYLDIANTPRKTRREVLKVQHGFVCNCKLCIADDVDNQAKTAVCDYCHKTAKQRNVDRLRNCTRCKTVRYCGREVRFFSSCFLLSYFS